MGSELVRPSTRQRVPSAPTRGQAVPPVSSAAGTAAIVRPPAHHVTEDVLDSVVLELNQVFRTGTVRLHLDIGRLIVTRLYGGDLRAWRAHGAKETSFQKLALRARSDLLVSASSLYRAVALFELTERLGISTWKYLGVSHLRAVLSLPDSRQRSLLTAAEANNWTVQRIEMEARALRGAEERRRGRRPLPPFVKSVRQLAKILLHPNIHLSGLGHIDRLSHDEVAGLHSIVVQTKEQIDALERRLQARLGGHRATK